MANYGFFDSVSGDRRYSAEDLTKYFLQLIPNGVITGGLAVTSSGGLSVSVSAGWGFIESRWFKNVSAYTLGLETADPTNPRIDRVTLKLDLSARTITIAAKTGTASATPSAPTLTRSSTVYELSLAQIYIAAGTTAITNSEITDERGDSTVCGYVTGFGALGGMTFQQLTRAEYDALPSYSNSTQYVVKEADNSISVYVGETELDGGSKKNYIVNGLRFSVKDQPVAMDVYDLSQDNIYLGNGFSISMALIVSDTTKDLSYTSRYVQLNTSSNNWFIAGLQKTGEVNLYYVSSVYRPLDYAGAWESDHSVTLLPNQLKWIQIDVLNDSEKTLKLYVNNELKETFTVSGGTVYGAAEKITSLAILRQVPAFSTYDRSCQGAGAADFLLYDRVLTDEERAENFSAAVSRYSITEEV
jgi:hypothetical protein